ncbi:hypothetical protein EJB05_28867, partial [Eragrostis curvula]
MKFIWMNLCAGLSEHGNEECTNEKFRKFANSLEQQKILNEYWNIVNKTFASEEEAYSFYNKYAFVKGFGIRRQNVRRAKYSRELLFRRFVCYKQGEREDKYLETEDCSRRPRAQTRCHCPAELAIRLDRSRGVWFVSNFVDEHNHCPAGPGEAPFLYGGYDRTPFQRKDIYNFSSKYKRKRIEHGDANTIIDGYIEHMTRNIKQNSRERFFCPVRHGYMMSDDKRVDKCLEPSMRPTYEAIVADFFAHELESLHLFRKKLVAELIFSDANDNAKAKEEIIGKVDSWVFL